MSTATFIVGNWTAVVRGSLAAVDVPTPAVGEMPGSILGTRTFAVAGPQHRLDVSFSVHGDYAARNLPHGHTQWALATASSLALAFRCAVQHVRSLWPVLCDGFPALRQVDKGFEREDARFNHQPSLRFPHQGGRVPQKGAYND